jgi:hypothetical protein
MTLEDLGNLGEFIGAIAVVVSLVYLAVQIRQNTKTVRTSTYQAVLNSNIQAQNPILYNPHVDRVYQLGRRDPSQLTAEEWPLFTMIIAQLLINYEATYLQHEHGVVDSDYWRGRQSVLKRFVAQPGVRAVWEKRAGEAYVSGFRALVDSFLAEADAKTEPAG